MTEKIRVHLPYTPPKEDMAGAGDEAAARGVAHALKLREKAAKKSWGARLLELIKKK